MRFVLKYIIVFLLITVSNSVVGGERYAHFDRYSVADGLSSNFVHVLTQDKYGHIWIGTDCGLNSFDGHVFKCLTKKDYPSLFRDDIYCLESRPDGSVLLGSYLGVLLRYNQLSDDFEDLSPLDFDSTYYKGVNSFFTTKNDDVYTCTTSGIYKYDKEKKRFVSQYPTFNLIKDINVCSMYIDKFGRFWICSFNMVYLYDEHGEFITKYNLASGHKQMFVANLFPINENKIAMSCFSDEIYFFDLNEDRTINQSTPLNTPFKNLNVILEDKNGHFWYTSDGDGLWYSDSMPTAETDFVKVVPYGAKESDFSKIYAMIEADNGDLWFGTQSTGVWRYRQNQDACTLTSSDIKYPFSMSSSFVEMASGDLFISSDGGGLTKLSSDYLQMKHYGTKNGLLSKNVLNLNKDLTGKIWVSTWGSGIFLFDPETETFTQEKFKGLSSNLNCFFSVTSMKNGEVWVSTSGDGLYVRNADEMWNRRTLSFSEKEHDMWPYKVIEGINDSRWIITTRSLWLVTNKDSKYLLSDFTKEKEHNPLVVRDAVCDSSGYLFAATNRNVLRFSPDGLQCDTLDFLPKTSYFSICLNKENQLCVSSLSDILIVDYQNRTYRNSLVDFSSKGNGYFMSRASFVDSKGRIYFGNKEGFVSLNINNNSEYEKISHFSFSDLYISGEKVKPYSSVLKDGGLTMLSSIELAHNQSEIDLSLDLVNFGKEKLICEYRLVNLNEKWMPVSNDRVIKFSYIPTGTYRLEVRAYSVNHPSDKKLITLDVNVLPPWWNTWWFRLLIVILVCSLVLSLIYIRFRNIQRRNVELENKVRERTHELDSANREILSQNNSLKESKFMIELKNDELDHALKSKDHLISIIAHDLKNPMFGIVGALESLNNNPENFDEGNRQKVIAELSETSRHLQTELVKLLEWATSQNQDLICSPRRTNMATVIQDNLAFFKGLSAEKNIEMRFENNLNHDAFVDVRMITVVIRNLLANALKFTPRNGLIRVVAGQTDSSISVSIIDNGVGMTEEQTDSVFLGKISTAGTENEKGTGLGMKTCKHLLDQNNATIEIKSEINKGTSISIYLPMVKDEEKEVVDEKESSMKVPVNVELLTENSALIVEDDALIRLHIRNLLEKYMTVYEAENGEIALNIIKQTMPDMILSDVDMPVMDGIKLAESVRSANEWSGIPFLFLSAKTSDEDRLKGLLSGAVDYLTKPFVDNELLVKLCNIMLLKRNQQLQFLQQRMDNVSEDDVAEADREEESNKVVDPFLKKIMDKIEEKYKDPDFAIDELCVDLGISQSSLNRKLKSLTGKTANVIISEFRLHKAKYLLESKMHNVSEVAYEVGFSDPHYFSRKYKAYFGVPPSEI